MGDYTKMSNYYDVIMTSGYYDYAKIVDGLLSHQPPRTVLEIGCGTGLILEELANRRPDISITGFDLTEAMLDIARERLEDMDNVSLHLQNVCHLDLPHAHDLAFSYGGVWYFVIDGDKEPFLVSHIASDAANHEGMARLATFVSPGGTLLLGIQGPHHNYQSEISNGMVYSQQIDPTPHGFTKHYFLNDGDDTVMAQTVEYRTYTFSEARQMMAAYGFDYAPTENRGKLFLGFKKS